MVILNINNVEYKVFESWGEITVKKSREFSVVANKIPDELAFIYKEQAKGKEADKDQITLYTKKLESIEKKLDAFYIDVLIQLSDIPKDIIKKTYIEDLRGLYEAYLFPFVFGILHFPLEKTKILNKFTIMGETYYAPKSKKIMGTVRPFFDQDASVFCDASDADSSARSGGNKYQYAELITAIVFRKKGEKYVDKSSIEISELYENILTCDIYHAALAHLSKVNTTLQLLFPNLYQKGDAKISSASKASGLADFGWFNSISTVAVMGLFNQSSKTNLDSARTANLYDLMTVLSNIRANSDFERIFREQTKPKK